MDSSSQIIANRFEIIASIGQGGMGEVFRGLDRQTGEAVAIKLLKPDIVQEMPGLLERFRREGEALSRLNHPNIVKMIAAIEENGRHYLVMQYVGGGSLRDLLDKTPTLPVERVLSIGMELADALTRAHHLKIIHRDLKPENVLLTEDGTPLLTDFGVARIGTRTRVTETGSVIGTYAYLSPEACMAAEDLDGRTDIWSFGVMLYEMLIGQRPFDSPHPTAVLLAILNNPMPDLAALRPDTPPALVDLIRRMLHKDREQRVPSVRLVGAALEAIQHGNETPLPGSQTPMVALTPAQPAAPAPTPLAHPEESDSPLIFFTPPVGATPIAAAPTVPPATTTVITAPADTKWKWIALAVMVSVLAISAVAIFRFQLLSDTRENDTPAAPTANLIPTVTPGQVIVQPPPGVEPPLAVDPVGPGEYMVLVAGIEPLGGAPPRDVSRLITDDLRARLENEIPFSNIRVRPYPRLIRSENEARAAAQSSGAAVIIWGNYTQDLIELEIQIGVTTAFPMIQTDRETLERTANVRVHLTDERRQSVAAQVLSVFNVLQTADGNGYEVARILAILDMLDINNGEIVSGGVAGHLQRAALIYVEDTPQAIEEYNAAIALQGSNPLLYGYRASGYLRMGMYDEALRDFGTALRLGPPGWTTPLYARGAYETAIGDTEKALATFTEIVDQRPNDWFPINYRGALYYLLGDHEHARADLERGIELSPNADLPYVLLTMLSMREGRLEEAQVYQKLILESPDPTFSGRLIGTIFGSQTPHIFSPMFAAAGSLVLGQYEQVITYSQQALALNDQLADMNLVQGLAYCNLGDYAAAEAAYTRGIEIDPDYIALYALRAEARARQGDMPGSLEDAQVIQQSDLAGAFVPLMQVAMTGGWSCEQYFDFDYSQIAAVPTTNLDPHQMDDAIEQQPDNGSLYFMRAWLWIVAGDNYAQARADLEQSLALDSSAGLPELLSILLAHREGRIDDAQGYMQAALTNISDPTLIQNDAEALFGGSMTNHFEKVFPIMARFGLGQYEDAYSDMEALLEPVLALSMPERDTMFQELDPASQHLLADQLAWRGLTACATGNYADAEESYTWALELNPDFALLYTLRAQARAAQGNAEGEAEDYRNAQERSPGPAFDPWIPAAQSGAWTCTNLFDYSLEAESS